MVEQDEEVHTSLERQHHLDSAAEVGEVRRDARRAR
jgi:hypothetical protein